MTIDRCFRVRCDFCRTNSGPPRLTEGDAIVAARDALRWVRRIFCDHYTGFAMYACNSCLIDNSEAREYARRGKALAKKTD